MEWVVGKNDFNENSVVSLDLDFGLRLRVNFQHSEKLSNTILNFAQTGIIVIYFHQEFDLSHELPTK